MNIYVVPEIDIERFKETGVFAVRLLNNEAMTHDGIYLESDRAKEFAEFFKDNIFPAEKFEELVEWGIKADAESASLVRAIIHSRVWEYEQKRAMTMDQVLVQFCIREYPSIQICALNFPFKTTMFLSEKEGVVVRDGYGAPPVRI